MGSRGGWCARQSTVALTRVRGCAGRRARQASNAGQAHTITRARFRACMWSAWHSGCVSTHHRSRGPPPSTHPLWWTCQSVIFPVQQDQLLQRALNSLPVDLSLVRADCGVVKNDTMNFTTTTFTHTHSCCVFACVCLCVVWTPLSLCRKCSPGSRAASLRDCCSWAWSLHG